MTAPVCIILGIVYRGRVQSSATYKLLYKMSEVGEDKIGILIYVFQVSGGTIFMSIITRRCIKKRCSMCPLLLVF